MSSLSAPTDRTAPATRRVQPAEALALFGLAVLLFRVVWATVDILPVDDAFISFRYARNLAEGHGLVFNLGERVEQSYRLVAQVKTRKGKPVGGRWVVEVEGFSPGLYRRGYRMGIFQRVTDGA